MRLLVALLTLSIFAVAPVEAAPPEAPMAGAPGFSATDSTGRTVRLSDFAGKMVVLEWTNPDCPYVKRHYGAGTMRRLADEFSNRGVVWLAVNSSHFVTAEAMERWRGAHGLSYPVLLDPAGEIGRAYGAKTTPHMFVLDASHRIVYSGAIDDDPHGDAKAAANYVAAVLESLTKNQPVSVASTKPYGCSVKYRG